MKRRAEEFSEQKRSPGGQRPWPSWGRKHSAGRPFDASGFSTAQGSGPEPHWIKDELEDLQGSGWEMTGGLLPDRRLVVVADDGEHEVVLLVDVDDDRSSPPIVFVEPEIEDFWNEGVGFRALVEGALKTVGCREAAPVSDQPDPIDPEPSPRPTKPRPTPGPGGSNVKRRTGRRNSP